MNIRNKIANLITSCNKNQFQSLKFCKNSFVSQTKGKFSFSDKKEKLNEKIVSSNTKEQVTIQDEKQIQKEKEKALPKADLGKQLFTKIFHNIETNCLKIPIPKNKAENKINHTHEFDYLSFYLKETDSLFKLSQLLNIHNGGEFKFIFLNQDRTPIAEEKSHDLTLIDLLSKGYIIKIKSVKDTSVDLDINCLADIKKLISNTHSKGVVDDLKNLNQFNSILNSNVSNNIIQKEIDRLIAMYSGFEKEMGSKKVLIEALLKKKISSYSFIALLYFLLHLILFYWLIYSKYGWDIVEPVTYLVGNVYWIAGLAFFAYKKKRLDLDYLLSKSFMTKLYKSFSHQKGYCNKSHKAIIQEIEELIVFKKSLNRNI